MAYEPFLCDDPLGRKLGPNAGSLLKLKIIFSIIVFGKLFSILEKNISFMVAYNIIRDHNF